MSVYKTKSLVFSVLSLFALILTPQLGQTAIQKEKLYVSSGARDKSPGKNAWLGAGGTACCGCGIEHYGALPEDFPTGEVSAVTFYLRDSRKDSYYTRVKRGSTELKLLLQDEGTGILRESTASSKPVGSETQLPEGLSKIGWTITFKFDPPVQAAPGTKWNLLDGDNKIYSAVILHMSNLASDLNTQNALPGTSDQNGCQYTFKEKAWYSVKFDYVPLVFPTEGLSLELADILIDLPKSGVLQIQVSNTKDFRETLQRHIPNGTSPESFSFSIPGPGLYAITSQFRPEDSSSTLTRNHVVSIKAGSDGQAEIESLISLEIPPTIQQEFSTSPKVEVTEAKRQALELAKKLEASLGATSKFPYQLPETTLGSAPGGVSPTEAAKNYAEWLKTQPGDISSFHSSPTCMVRYNPDSPGGWEEVFIVCVPAIRPPAP